MTDSNVFNMLYIVENNMKLNTILVYVLALSSLILQCFEDYKINSLDMIACCLAVYNSNCIIFISFPYNIDFFLFYYHQVNAFYVGKYLFKWKSKNRYNIISLLASYGFWILCIPCNTSTFHNTINTKQVGWAIVP